MLFQYKAITLDGKKTHGVIDADSILMAKERLKKQQLMVIDLLSLKDNRKEATLDSKMLVAFTRELQQLLCAGLPLYESLITIEEKYRRHKSHSLFLDLCDHLKGGSLLSQAMKKYPKTFNGIYLAMISMGEASGSLASALEELNRLLSREQKLKKQLVSALFYPSFLCLFCVFVVIIFLFFVIPSMAELFEGRTLHPLTSVVLGVSNWVNHHTYLFFGVLFGLPISGFFFSRSPRGKRLGAIASLRLPLLKKLIVHAALIRFCRSISSLLSGGVPLLEALSLAKKGVRHTLFEELIDKTEIRLKEGEKLSAQLKAAAFLPPLVGRMVSIAEETGQMAPMLQDVAEIYDEDLERSLAQLTAFLQPILLLMLGTIVGIVLLSILIPLTDVSSFIGG